MDVICARARVACMVWLGGWPNGWVGGWEDGWSLVLVPLPTGTAAVAESRFLQGAATFVGW